MKSLIQRMLAVVAVTASVVTGVVTTSGPAAASTCGAGTNSAGQRVYFCPVWVPSGGIPVYASTSTGSTIVDRLYTGGTANWFYCQQNGSVASGYGYSSSNWAKTKGDNSGAVGWVPAIYYSGAENYWPGMPSCSTSGTKIVTHTFYAQINGYYCGPAAAQIALTSWGKNWSNQGFSSASAYQSYLASRLGTTNNGTSSIANVSSVLNSIAGTSYYQNVWISGSYATSTQKTALRSALKTDVGQGRALVANVVGTAVDTAGVSHGYSGGHFLAVTGYAQDGALARISDNAYGSASSGEYWMTTDRLADWIAERGYAA